ncbi:allergin-1 isoform X2 [Cavia porcellus]
MRTGRNSFNLLKKRKFVGHLTTARGAPTSLGRMRGCWNKLLFWGVFSSLTFSKALLGCKTMKNPKEFPSPSLNSSTPVITVGQNVSLYCSHENTSLHITYSLFLHKKHLETKKGIAESVIFHHTISKANDSGPYKCKAEAFNCSKYSPAFYFLLEERNSCPLCLLLMPIAVLILVLLAAVLLLVCLIPKYKARKALRDNAPTNPGDTPTEGHMYENVYKHQAGRSQEIHYAVPVFQESVPREQEASADCKTGYIYSELTFDT